MGQSPKTDSDSQSARTCSRELASIYVHPLWLSLIRYCSELGHGEIEKLKIQDGLPMTAEITRKRVKFGS